MALIELQHLSFTYPNAASPALSEIDFKLSQGSFTALCGPSGSGKSTLLRLLKPGRMPTGAQTGTILFAGAPQDAIAERKAAADIGFVAQDPDAQIVTDKVWHELAFGAESLGFDPTVIRRAVAEMASFFGIEPWFHRNTADLSGGQKQLLNLAAVMVTQPKLLLLDEPTAQLDPIAAGEFLAALQKLNRELGTTILLCEHRLEDVLPLCDQVAILDAGRLLDCGSVRDVGLHLKETDSSLLSMFPTAMRVWSSISTDLPCPVTVSEGRAFLSAFAQSHSIQALPPAPEPPQTDVVLSVKELRFSYGNQDVSVLKSASLSLRKGELLCVLGGNGAGKSTALRLFAGTLQPQSGTIDRKGVAALLPQDPTLLFLKKTVYDDVCSAAPDAMPSDALRAKAQDVFSLCRLGGLETRHPFDLSGGEQQRAALAKLLLRDPDILLLDEPTKGFDTQFKAEFAALLRQLCNRGVSVLMVSHDVEFCAAYADRVALLFDGSIVTTDTPRRFFSGNRFYTTAANRMAREILPEAVTPDDLITAIGGHLQQPSIPPRETPVTLPQPSQPKTPPLARWRKVGTAVCALGALATVLYAAKEGSLRSLVDAAGVTALGTTQLAVYGALLGWLLLLFLFSARKPQPNAAPRSTQPIAKRGILIGALVPILMVGTLFLGVKFGNSRSFYLIALALLFEAIFPVFLRFEQRKPQAKELVLLAALTALNVAGRAAFFMLPQFKPVLAMTVIVGVSLGAQSGFLVGAMTMLVSNILFSQGPWTPWQMFAMGLIGALAGLLFRRGRLPCTKLSFSIFGAVSAIVIYGGILNPASALIWGGGVLNAKMLLSYYVTGFPMDVVHAAASFLFLWFLSEPMLETLERVKVKYGISPG